MSGTTGIIVELCEKINKLEKENERARKALLKIQEAAPYLDNDTEVVDGNRSWPCSAEAIYNVRKALEELNE